jgi:hypothetical protein
MRLLGRGVYRCTICHEVVRSPESDTLPVVVFVGDGDRMERSVTVRDIEIHRCRVADRPPVDIVARGSSEWIDHALCGRSAHPEWWFPEEGDSPRLAKKTCSMCPVIASCLAFAIDNDIDAGIWGGQTARERRRTARRRESAA